LESTGIIDVLKPVIQVVNELSITYYIGGSLASSIHGLPRSTLDIDLIADVQQVHIPVLKNKLKDNFYIDEDMIKDAIQRQASFNLIHLDSAIKIDVFIQKKDKYQLEILKRIQKDRLIESDSSAEFYFCSPEDIILIKLKWYDDGDRISERQWLDVIGVIRVQHNNLDMDYLKVWAQRLGISKLLNLAFKSTHFDSDSH